jgi:DNA-binding NtrC family response regulator
MARTRTTIDSLQKLLDRSNRPIYVVDSRRRVVYCNAALAKWLQLEPERIIGRVVEYHSIQAGDEKAKADPVAPLADLCPPPRALAGEACAGTISCAALGGRLAHRHAEFVPLDSVGGDPAANGDASGVLVLLSARELSPQELAKELSENSPADEIHRAIRQFRRAQSRHYAVESLLGESPVMAKVRAQVQAAASSGANVLIQGRPGSGRGHVARAIHYHALGDASVQLLPIDCRMANDDLIRRALDAVHATPVVAPHRPTLLLENLASLDSSHQSQLLAAIRHGSFRARVIATMQGDKVRTVAESTANDAEAEEATVDRALLDHISTITIHLPPLCERLDELHVLTQCLLEARNRGNAKQVGSVRSDALDQLSLYCWPGELDELREVVAAAHAACSSHEITPADLPAVIHHAVQKASRNEHRLERIVLDELLATIEREAIEAALAQAKGNKSEAAELLGMTRPRLYRRLVQLGFVVETKEAEPQQPEFIERPEGDE